MLYLTKIYSFLNIFSLYNKSEYLESILKKHTIPREINNLVKKNIYNEIHLNFIREHAKKSGVSLTQLSLIQY